MIIKKSIVFILNLLILFTACSSEKRSVQNDISDTPETTVHWSDTLDLFIQHLSKVKQGWSKEELMHYAGKPAYNETNPNVWEYKYEIHDGPFTYFIFIFKDEIILDIKTGTIGCVLWD